jgi:hypothetical protein
VAVFIDGLNDFYHAGGTPTLAPEIGAMVEAQQRGATVQAAHALARLPAVRAMGSLARTAPPAPDYRDEAVNRAVVRRWRANRRLIEGVSREFGVASLFVWQPVPVYRYDLRYHATYTGDPAYFSHHERSRHGYPVMARLGDSLAVGGNFLWLADIQQGRRESLYVDGVHYTSAFSREIASHLRSKLVQGDFVRCAPPR